MAIQAKEGRAEQKVEGFKQQLTAQPTLEPVDTFVELEEIVEETEDDKEEETPIIDCQERIKKKEEQEKQKQKNSDYKKKKIVSVTRPSYLSACSASLAK